MSEDDRLKLPGGSYRVIQVNPVEGTSRITVTMEPVSGQVATPAAPAAPWENNRRPGYVALQAKLGWQPLRTAPTDATPVFLARIVNSVFELVGIGRYNLSRHAWDWDWRRSWLPGEPTTYIPTHWLPIPGRPKY